MLKKLSIMTLTVALAAAVACGSKDAASDAITPVEEPRPVAVIDAPAGESEGVAVAREILAVFDAAVAEVLQLVKDKPEAAVLQPKLDELFAAHKAKMADLNVTYLALRDKGMSVFGEANTYLGENRGKHVFQKDNVLGEAVAYYNFQKGEQGIVQFLSLELPKLIDVAVQR